MKNKLMNRYGGKTVNYNLEEIANCMFAYTADDFEFFLNVRDGSIVAEEMFLKDIDELDYEYEENNYMRIWQDNFDFYPNFMNFLKTVNNEDFLNAFESVGHGKGAIRRIKDLMYEYPAVQQRWYSYENDIKLNKAKEWLEMRGLI